MRNLLRKLYQKTIQRPINRFGWWYLYGRYGIKPTDTVAEAMRKRIDYEMEKLRKDVSKAISKTFRESERDLDKIVKKIFR